MALPFQIDDVDALDREVPVAGETHEAPRLCRIALSANAPHPIMLRWNPGKGPGVRSRVELKPGAHCVEELTKAEIWFGPFTVPERFALTTDEKKKAGLQQFWRTEKKRALDRYDYPRMGGPNASMQIIGQHRFPDVTVTVIEPDGAEHEPIRLHELYRIGEFDITPIEMPESADDVRAEYEAKIAAERTQHEQQMADLRREVAAMGGQLKGFIDGLKTPVAAGKKES